MRSGRWPVATCGYGEVGKPDLPPPALRGRSSWSWDAGLSPTLTRLAPLGPQPSTVERRTTLLTVVQAKAAVSEMRAKPGPRRYGCCFQEAHVRTTQGNFCPAGGLPLSLVLVGARPMSQTCSTYNWPHLSPLVTEVEAGSGSRNSHKVTSLGRAKIPRQAELISEPFLSSPSHARIPQPWNMRPSNPHDPIPDDAYGRVSPKCNRPRSYSGSPGAACPEN